MANKKPKLLLVADTYYPKVDGTLIFMEEFLQHAQDQFDVALLVPFLGEKKGKNVHYLDVYKHLQVSGYPSVKFSWKNLKTTKAAIKEADIVFIQGPALISYLSIYFAHRAGKKTVFYTHTLAWELFEKFAPPLLNRLLFRFIRRTSFWLFHFCDLILVPYHELRDQLQDEGLKSNIGVARLGVDINRFTPSKDKKSSKRRIGLDEEKTVIGYVGRISKEKNVSTLSSAFKRLHNPKKMFLLMVGDGPESQIKVFKENPNCLVTGFVRNVPEYLQAMDIFVMPSLTETTSLATLEAMSCGLPVIATKVGFIKRYLVKNHNGLFIPRNSPGILALKIEALLKDRNLRERLGENARKTVAYSFSWERSINKIKRMLMEQYYENR